MRDRTADLLRAKQALSQLSYSPSITGLFAPLLRCTCRSLSCVPDVRTFARSGVRLVETQKSCVLRLLDFKQRRYNRFAVRLHGPILC